MGKTKKYPIISFMVWIFILSLAIMGPTKILAADYPTRPITMFINMSAGGTTDTVSRKLADLASKELGQPIVPVNKAGGGGTIGVNEITRSEADGYYIGTISLPTLAVIPHLRNLPYDPLKDISHICCLLPYDMGLIVKSDSPWKTFEDLIEYSKQHPGEISYGSPGPGTINHLSVEMITRHYNIKWKHVPFRGMAEGTTALLGGHIDLESSPPGSVMQLIKAGKLRLLIVTTENRWLKVPDVPTIREKGHDVILTSYLSLGAPAGTPEAHRQKLENAFKKAMSYPDINRELEEVFSTRLQFMSGKEYAKFMKDQFYLYKNFLKSIGMIK